MMGKNTHRKQSQEEKCELLALVTAQSDKLPQWNDLTVNSPLRRARSRGTTSQSPGCSPAQEQLQPPSACSTLHLPEWSVCHLLCYDRDKFNEIKCEPMSFFFLRDEGFHGRSCEIRYRKGMGWIKYDELHNVQLSLLMQKYCCGHFSLGAEYRCALRTVQVTADRQTDFIPSA